MGAFALAIGKGFLRPMAISEEQVRHVALLARLALTDDQIERIGEELNSILGHIDSIQQLDLEGVEPTAHPLEVVNVTRGDVVKPGLSREDALRNAPQAEDGAFVIPQIVGPGGDDA
jgi:aspartyl-tRNA(Asn)/glutamyl-tRNA(Gln) amidotransferase subunit C